MKNQKALYLLPIKESGGKDMVKAELWELGYKVNHKVVERLHRSFYLTVMRKTRKPRVNPIQKLLKQVEQG